MVPSMTALARRRPIGAPPRLRLHADGMRHRPGDAAGRGPARRAVAFASIARSVVDQLTVFTNLELKNAYPGTHATSNAAFMSAAKAKWTESTDYHLGTTVDQIAAKGIGQETALPSLELAMDLLQMVGQCDNGYACVYQNNLSWSSPTTPLPAEAHPRIVFERLFGEGGSTADRRAALRRRASLLDWVSDDMSRLQKKLGPGDRTRVNEYLETVREVERRIQKAEAGDADNQLPDLDRPVGVPAAYADHARLMFDLQGSRPGGCQQVITDSRRETSPRTYAGGVHDPHHPLTNMGTIGQVGAMAKINAFSVAIRHYLEAEATPEGEVAADNGSICTAAGWSDTTCTTK